MANTFTPTYNILKPEVGADTNAWGTHINNNLDIIDTHMLSRSRTTAQTFAGPLTFNQTLTVLGAATLDSTLLVTGASTLNSISTTGAASFGTTMAVTGATTLNTLNVTGATTMASNGLNVGSGQLAVTGGNVSMSGNLNVTGNVSAPIAATTLAASGATSLSGTLGVAGLTTLTGNLVIQSGSSERSITVGNSGGYFYGGPSTVGWKDSSGNARIYWDTSGNFVAAQNITAFSDARLKSDITTIENAMAYISRMRGVWYRYKETDKPGTGVIAQEVMAVIPELVEDNDGVLSVAYGNFAGVFIQALKELSERIEKLEASK